MIQAALARHAGVEHASFTADASQLAPADYVVASGIFNVKLGHTPEAWWDYVLQTLAIMASLCRRGFAFNMLTTHSDPDKQTRRSLLRRSDAGLRHLPAAVLAPRRAAPRLPAL